VFYLLKSGKQKAMIDCQISRQWQAVYDRWCTRAIKLGKIDEDFLIFADNSNGVA
jgi:hypothetical protein